MPERRQTPIDFAMQSMVSSLSSLTTFCARVLVGVVDVWHRLFKETEVEYRLRVSQSSPGPYPWRTIGTI
jgi:hypothetical protein